jgi:Fe-S oxidoreductase
MLTINEKIIFTFLLFAAMITAIFATCRLTRIISSGLGKPDWRLAVKRLFTVIPKIIIFKPVFRFRFWSSFFHALIGWGFIYFIFVNLVDAIDAYFPKFLIPGIAGKIFLLLTDVFSVTILIGIIFFVIRRYVFKPANLSTRDTTFLIPEARTGIKYDSAIVAGFIFLHIGSHFLNESIAIVSQHQREIWQPFASYCATLMYGINAQGIVIIDHVTFWLAFGSIFVFIPYFQYSKHLHLIFAPLNFLLKPKRNSIGEMSYIDIYNQSNVTLGAAKLTDLGWEQLMDAFACIMCFRCQEVCPAYQTGKVLSPAALEINKRYLMRSSIPDVKLVDSVIPAEAIWACTTCGACIDICPVGNEPMRDILDIRRNLSLTLENAAPKKLNTVFLGIEQAHNPWNIPAFDRMKWAEGLSVPTIRQNPSPDVLWWVGCAPAIDPRAQKTARDFAKILISAKVNFSILGDIENCTGDIARRAGREDIFFELAQINVAQLNNVKPKRIVTTCPHCLNTIKNEYPAFGGYYEIIHHSQLILELIENGQLIQSLQPAFMNSIVYHDPCYLGRINNIFAPPRQVLSKIGINLKEMPHHAENSFCCGAGGAQMWKDEEIGKENINTARLAEAISIGAQTVAVACPFCLTMLEDAAKGHNLMEVKDIAEIVASTI